MNSYPSIEISFTIEGTDLNLEELTKKLMLNLQKLDILMIGQRQLR